MEIPNHFDEDFIVNVIAREYENSAELPMFAYPLSLGLLVKCEKVLRRLHKRKRIDDSDTPARLYKLIDILTGGSANLKVWDGERLLCAAKVLEEKCFNLSGTLLNALDAEPLFPPVANADGYLSFRQSFLDTVNAYHETLQRPAEESCVMVVKETASEDKNCMLVSDEELRDPLIAKLASLPREVCDRCGGHRQIYCGKCGGIRMPLADKVLPSPIEIPFDILLVLHWYVFRVVIRFYLFKARNVA